MVWSKGGMRHLLEVAALMAACCSFAHAQGTCPSGVPVTGNHCYFVAANGSDSNDGLSEASGHPWAHAPGMPNCASNCAALQTAMGSVGSSYPGIGIIFRGGDTWHFGNSSATPYTGGTWTWNWNGSQSTTSLNCDTTGGSITGTLGTTTSCQYIGVDLNWYSGSSWARPIFTGDNPICSSTSCTGGTYPNVSSCAHQIGSNNDLIVNGGEGVTGFGGVIWDNFELTGLCQAGVITSGQAVMFTEGSPAIDQVKNMYFHGGSHVTLTCGTICVGITAFKSGSQARTLTTYNNNVCDGSDSDPGGFACLAGAQIYNFFDNIFRYSYQFEGGDCFIQHDNIWEYWSPATDGVSHGNMMECNTDAAGSQPNLFYNNISRHSNYPGIPIVWFCTNATAAEYWFNNIIYDIGSGSLWDIDQHDYNCVTSSTQYMFNNTLEAGTASGNVPCEASMTVYNEHVIGENGSGMWDHTACTGGYSDSTNITMTHAKANSQGYTSTGGMNYGGQSVSTCANEATPCAPTAGSNSTVGAGSNRTSYCTALATAGLTLAANACKYGTTDGCSYNTSTHTMSCPSQVAGARPGDVGAYQYNTNDPPPNPPTALSVIVH